MLNDILYHIVAPIIVALIASGGFWTFLQRQSDRPRLQTDLLIGLAHDRIIYLGIKYLERGWIYHDEHENLTRFLYAPYNKLGGNGSAKRIMDEVNRLPMKHHSMHQIKKGDKNAKETIRNEQ